MPSPKQDGLDWFDISLPLHNSMVHWPEDPPFHIERVHEMARGDPNNLSVISMSAHSGTHIDAPLHFLQQGIGIDRMPLATTIGRARVIEIHDKESIKPRDLIPHRIRHGERILFKTRNSSRFWQTDSFVKEFVFISGRAALYLAKRRVKVIGIDYLSVGGFKKNGAEVHRILLESGIWIIEGLDLSGVSPGRYDMICLPLKISEGEGAPARAILRPAGKSQKS